jgi:hypothetical protein
MKWLPLIVTLLKATAVIAADDKPTQPPPPLETLVARLVETDKVGFGYSAQFSGTQFLPRTDSGDWKTGIIGAAPPTTSDALTMIVERGADAIPVLLAHMDDKRPTKLKPISGMMWMGWNDEYDYNRRSRKIAPEGVNRDSFKEANHPAEHQITVGDLCFVALGQIVNRSFNATRYQPSGGLIVNSPTYSKRLLDVIRADHAGLTKEKHREQLIEDFKRPDHEYRRNGAAMRLGFYYQEALEPLVIAQLKAPVFDSIICQNFTRDVLYAEPSIDRRKVLLDAHIAKYGSGSKDGVLLQLFEDLRRQERDEERNRTPSQNRKYDARNVLIQLYGYEAGVKSSQVPYVESLKTAALARFIESLGPSNGTKINDAVFHLFSGITDDDYLALACMKVLAGKGHDTGLINYCRRRIPIGEHWSAELTEMLQRLQKSPPAKGK